MGATTNFHEVARKQAIVGFAHEVRLESSKKYNDLHLYLYYLMENLHPQMDEMLRAKGRGIIFWWRVQVTFNVPLVRDLDYEEQDN